MGANNNYWDQTYRTTTNVVFAAVGKEMTVEKYLDGFEVGINTMDFNKVEFGFITASIITWVCIGFVETFRQECFYRSYIVGTQIRATFIP